MSQATGAQVQTTVNGLSDSALGTCAQFQEKQVSCLDCNQNPLCCWVLCLTLAECKFMASMQRRIGPDIVGV